MARGLLKYITSSQILDAGDQHNINRCFPFLVQSLSTCIVTSLPALLCKPLSPDPAELWKQLKPAYSAAVGARQGARVQELQYKNHGIRWAEFSGGHILLADRTSTTDYRRRACQIDASIATATCLTPYNAGVDGPVD